MAALCIYIGFAALVCFIAALHFGQKLADTNDGFGPMVRTCLVAQYIFNALSLQNCKILIIKYSIAIFLQSCTHEYDPTLQPPTANDDFGIYQFKMLDKFRDDCRWEN